MSTNTTTRTITHNGVVLSYELHRKQVKNINLRIHTDGTVTVSASPAVPLTYIDDFIASKVDRIVAIQAHHHEVQQLSPTTSEFIDGARFYILGEPYILSLSQGVIERVQIVETSLLVTTSDITDTHQIEVLLYYFMADKCKSLFGEMSNSIAPLFQQYGIAQPHMRLRTMKTQWGSCLPRKGIITLNTKLIEVPIACIEYVILHEYCHFVHPNHSKDFYNCVAEFMPDWAVRRQALKKWA